ncbi:MAG: YjfB family protein [Planctomycetota bacterium]|jgi:hypothetical protein
MDITSIEGASAFQAAQTQQKVGMAVLAKSMDIAKVQGEAVVDLIESAAQITANQPGHSANASAEHRLDVTI